MQQSLTYKDPTKENWFLVSWTLSNKCNYKCDYCPTYLHDGSTGHPDWNVVKSFVENFSLKGKEICYRISGGEPTHWKHFIDLAALIKQRGNYFSFLTNGSKSVDYFKKINQYTDGLIISYHPQYADINHIKQIIDVIDCPIAINLMMIPDKFDDQKTVAHELFNRKDNVLIWPKVILDKSMLSGELTNDVAEYTSEQKLILDNWPYIRKVNDPKLHRGDILLNNERITANDLILSGRNNFYGWKCWAGLHMLSIDKWGDIYRADCQRGGKIGNMKDYSIPTEPFLCDSIKCSCLSDIYLKKELI